jgi:8-oxo-dGTP pyrophosphatase MutT (NUDIX family)
VTGAGPARPDDPPGLAARLARCLPPLVTPVRDLPLGGYRPNDVERPRPAAVLVGILATRRPGVLLTVRSDRLARHAGQVAFPGGGRESGDRGIVDTALREAHEEIGLEPDRVHPVGFLGRYDTISGYRMTAVVGVVSQAGGWRPDGVEVERVFTVPLAQVADDDCYRRDRLRYAGRSFEILTLKHPEVRIWGATAALLHDLGARLRAAGFADAGAGTAG